MPEAGEMLSSSRAPTEATLESDLERMKRTLFCRTSSRLACAGQACRRRASRAVQSQHFKTRSESGRQMCAIVSLAH